MLSSGFDISLPVRPNHIDLVGTQFLLRAEVKVESFGAGTKIAFIYTSVSKEAFATSVYLF